MKYVLLDSNVTAGYYLARSLNSKNARERVEILFDSKRSGKTDLFFYLPNFCVAEVFSVFMKHCYGTWNPHVKKKGTIDTRIYKKLVMQFQDDIHNGKFIYHYELSRYHVLGINLVAPVDHYFKINRKGRTVPMGTFDHLIISMGIHLQRIHGAANTVVVTADDRISDILRKCKQGLPAATIKKLALHHGVNATGQEFEPATFPECLNLKTAKKKDLEAVFGSWPLPIGKIPNRIGRHTTV